MTISALAARPPALWPRLSRGAWRELILWVPRAKPNKLPWDYAASGSLAKRDVDAAELDDLLA
jgi:hypothetical protein